VDWYDLAEQDLIKGHPGLPYVNDDSVPYRIILHMTQGWGYYLPHRRDGSYLGVWTPPQATVAINGVFQHIPFTKASYAAVNAPGGVQTNLWHALQIEIHYKSEWAADLPEEIKEHLYPLLSALKDEFNVQGPIMPFYGAESYGLHTPWRMSFNEWHGFNGICGHQHVPENEHWDPGRLNLSDFEHVSTKTKVRAMYEPALQVAATCAGPEGMGTLAVGPDGSFYNFNAPLSVPAGWVLGPNGQPYWTDRADRVATRIEMTGPNSWRIYSDEDEGYDFPYNPST
jgi:hypothetical protein